MSNRGRSTSGEAAVPYYVRAPHIEAAKHLRLTAGRYIADRASLKDVQEAMAMLIEAVDATRAATSRPPSEAATPVPGVCLKCGAPTGDGTP